ncbi:hypothetical protein [Nigerium sp.]|uniref:hypothetical protein n=1 Tax=Nigerium sp. TaxID=2042655 RepID=UPI003221A661
MSGEVDRPGDGRAIVGIVAVVYGLGVAFGAMVFGEAWPSWWLMGGALVVGLLWVVFMVVPWATRRGRAR